MITYTVKDGDTLVRIAKRYYGDYAKYHLIAEHNHIVNPHLIPVGLRIELPDAGRSFRFPLTNTNTPYYKYGTMYSAKSRWHGKPHPGVDFHDYEGAPVYAVGEGVVIRNSFDPNGYGHYLVIEHRLVNDCSIWTLYAHLANGNLPRIGTRIAGDNVAIGQEGCTGAAGLPHLHFEVKRTAQLGLYSIIDLFNLDKYFINPYTFIRNEKYLPVE